MTDETPKVEQTEVPTPRVRAKRDIFRFNGEKPTAINLEHVSNMWVEGKKITFEFYTTSKFVEMADEDAALSAFEVMLRAWAGDVLE